jgi:5-methylthioadenosine/S-adenosylhomocysteine deaminase
MTTIYSARWVLPMIGPPIPGGAVAVEGTRIAGVGAHKSLAGRFADASVVDCGEAAIIPGLVNSHSHLELTAMRGFLESEESDFFAWLRKLTLARLERMTPDDIHTSALWGACEAARAGVTCVGDASDSAVSSMRAVREVGLRGIVFQESFGPDPRLVKENVEKLKDKVAELRALETRLVRAGVSPHSPYTVCGTQLEAIADLAVADDLPVMMHAAESAAEELFIRDGQGIFAEGLARRGIASTPKGVSPVQYLKQVGVLDVKPLLAHCIRVDDRDIQLMAESGAKVAHCPKSNAKLRHGRAPLTKFVKAGIAVGLGSDSVASNNTCDLIEEARFAGLLSRLDGYNEAGVTPGGLLELATWGGAKALGLEGQVGKLQAGLEADLAVVSLAGVHQIPVFDPVSALLFASSGRDVVLTVVAGREVFRAGRVLEVDEDGLRKRMEELVGKMT